MFEVVSRLRKFTVFLIITHLFFLNGALRAMERGEEKDLETKTLFLKQVPSENQQNQMDVVVPHMTPKEKAKDFLDTPLSSSVILLMDAWTLSAQEKCSFDTSMSILAQEEDDNKWHRKLTVRGALEDKKIPNFVTRYLFMGLLAKVSKEDKKVFNFEKLVSQQTTPMDLNEWCILYLSFPLHHLSPRPVMEIMYPDGSVTDWLIRDYCNIRSRPYLAKKMLGRPFTVGQF